MQADVTARRRFHGYHVAVGGFLVYGVGVGTVYFTAAPLTAAIVPDLKFNIAVFSGIFTVRSVLGFAYPLWGWLVHRFGAKQVMVAGGIATAILLAVTAALSNVIGFYLVFGVALAAADGLMAYLPVFTTVNHWFIRYRGTVTGFVNAGAGVGGFVFAPVVQLMIQHLGGWRQALIGLAGFVIILGVLPALLLITNRPEDRGEYPDGVVPKPQPEQTTGSVAMAQGLAGANSREVERQWSVGQALRTPQVWLILTIFGIESWALGVYAVDQVIYLKSVGVSPLAASTALGVSGLVAAVAGIVLSPLNDRIGTYWVILISTTLMTAGALLFLFARSVSLVFAFVIIFGAGYGTFVPTVPVALSRYYGANNYALIYGWAAPVNSLLGGFGPLVTGIIVDVTGHYTLALQLIVALLVISIVLALIARPPTVSPSTVKSQVVSTP
ncbi:MAG TPA: MFS transporter [Candidatus Dormibacteraeota bacterium]|nr:MFS transporter [Candidatus Dormibacteraeota bacterium]